MEKPAVIVEQDEDGYFVASCPALKGCWSQGHTEDEALSNIREAIAGWLQAEHDRAREAVGPGQTLREVTI